MTRKEVEMALMASVVEASRRFTDTEIAKADVAMVQLTLTMPSAVGLPNIQKSVPSIRIPLNSPELQAAVRHFLEFGEPMGPGQSIWDIVSED